MRLGTTEKKDIQTFKFLADSLNTDLDTIAKWFIISLIFVFDPLAIALILAYNVAVYRKEDERVYEGDKKFETPNEPTVVENIENINSQKLEPISSVETTIIQENPKTEEILNNSQKEPSEPLVNQPINSSEMDDYYKRMFKH